MTVRVGHIPFLNCYPLYYGLVCRGMLAYPGLPEHAAEPVALGSAAPDNLPSIELIPGVPTELNRMMAAGEIDLGPISSIAYARNHRQLLLSRHVSISSRGAVDSIQLVARRPLESLRSVALTKESATSVALLKTILKLRFQCEVQYEELVGSVEEALAQHDAVLLIGDQGLRALYRPTVHAVCHDLGLLWQEWTGMPMVYAVWAAREDFARTDGAELLAVETELVGCMDYGRRHLPQVVSSALGRYPFTHEELSRYFALLHYDFPPAYQHGLLLFYELAHEAGELEEVPQLRFIDEFVNELRGQDGGSGPRQAGKPSSFWQQGERL